MAADIKELARWPSRAKREARAAELAADLLAFKSPGRQPKGEFSEHDHDMIKLHFEMRRRVEEGESKDTVIKDIEANGATGLSNHVGREYLERLFSLRESCARLRPLRGQYESGGRYCI